MTDEEKILAVAAKLTGEFYVGQRVRINCSRSHFHGDWAYVVDSDVMNNYVRVELEVGRGVDLLKPVFQPHELL